MTLTEKIQSLTDLELAELWDLNHNSYSLDGRITLREPPKHHQDFMHLLDLYELTQFGAFINQKKEIIEAMRAEIVKRYLNQNKLTVCDNCGEESERISTGSICSKCYC